MAYHSNSAQDFGGQEMGSRWRERREYEDDDGKYSAYSGKRDFYPPSQPRPASAPVYSPPHDVPPMPTGWTPQWDEHYKRWFYHDPSTGRSQWEAPGYVQPRPPMPGARDRHAHEYGDGGKEKKKGGGYGGMLLGAAGGVAAGALISHAIDDDSSSDDEHHAYSQGAPIRQAVYAQPTEYARSDRSSSDRESDHGRRSRSSSVSSSAGEESRERYDDDQYEEEEYSD